MSTIKGSSLRIGGLNSGLDTEAIVNAMSASTKLRITTNQRKVLKLQAQQEAYRSIIDKFNNFKDKYFDILNGDTFLRSRTTFNRHSASISVNGDKKTPAGVKVTTNANATAGNYNVKVEGVATQASMTSKPTDTLSAKFDTSAYNDSSKTYAMTITVGGVSKVIAFKGDADEEEVAKNINAQLVKAYGKTNNTDKVGDPGFGKGIVFFDEDEGKFVSTEKKAISTSLVSNLDEEVSLGNIASWDTGKNSITFIIDGETRTVNFDTLANDYFADIKDFTHVVNGALVLNHPAIPPLPTTPPPASASQSDKDAYEALLAQHQERAEQRQTFNLFNQVMRDMYDKERLDAFNDWKDHTDHNDSFKSVALTWQDRRAVLEGMSGISFDFDAVTDKITFDPDTEPVGYANAVNAALNTFISSLNATQRGEVSEAMNERHLEKIKDSMTPEQLSLFNDEVARRNAETNQQLYDRAVSDAYDKFYAWQRDTLGLRIGQASGQNIIHFNEWKEIMGLTANPPATVPASGNWEDIIPGATEMQDKVKAYFEDRIDALNPSDFTEIEDYNKAVEALENRLAFWEDKNLTGAVDVTSKVFKDAHTTANNRQIDELMFIRGAYSEQNAFFTQYSGGAHGGQSLNSFITSTVGDAAFDATKIAYHFNESAVNNVLGNVRFNDGTRIEQSINEVTGEVTFKAYTLDPLGTDDTRTYDERKIYKDLGVYANEGSENDFGLDTAQTTVSTISTSTRLSELGLTPDESGKYTFEINGAKFSFESNTTINQMMVAVNSNAAANVTMTFSTLSNSFEIKTKDFGTGANIVLEDGKEGLLEKLGFTDDIEVVAGTNMSLVVNGEIIETASNSYEVNGTIITIGPNVAKGTEFDIEVTRDSEALKDLIKEFVKDYNELIEFVFGFVNDKPDSAYHFLTDHDRDELNLSDIQEKRWEDKAKQGLLYNDRTLISLMSKMRTTFYSGISRGDGTMFGLFSMGITTSDNWKQNGKLVIDEKKLERAIENDLDMITELFTNAEKGIMPQLQSVIDSAVKTTGARHEKGLLIQKAGMKSGSSVNDNAIFDQIKRLNDLIGNLETRYQKQQDRYWKIFSNLEKQMGQLNSQTDYISQMAGGSMWDTRR